MRHAGSGEGEGRVRKSGHRTALEDGGLAEMGCRGGRPDFKGC